ncbi:MAG TPA: hypothetical protein VIX90_17575 [Edaphobacter sp.]
MFRLTALVVLGLSLVPSEAKADAIYNFDGGPAKTAGSVDVTLTWTNKTGTVTVPLTVPVPVGATRDVIRTAVETALNTNASVKADWTFKPDDAGFGKVYWTQGTPGAGVTLVAATIVPTPAKGPTGKLTISGGFTTASLNTPPQNWFAVTGTGTADDAISVTLATPGDTDYADLQEFSLASYAGLNGNQIDEELAALINGSGFGFDATVIGSQVFVSGINTELGADMLISDAGGLQVESGVHCGPRAGYGCLIRFRHCAPLVMEARARSMECQSARLTGRPR